MQEQTQLVRITAPKLQQTQNADAGDIASRPALLHAPQILPVGQPLHNTLAASGSQGGNTKKEKKPYFL